MITLDYVLSDVLHIYIVVGGSTASLHHSTLYDVKNIRHGQDQSQRHDAAWSLS